MEFNFCENRKFKNLVLNSRAYTLIEILVAVSIFSIAVSVPTALFISSLHGQNRTLALRETVDTASYVIEYMSRSLRMAKKDDRNGVNCLLGNKVNYETSDGNRRIDFRNHNNECQAFYLDGTTLKENKGGNILELTPDDLEITEVIFEVWGQGQDEDYQPRVTINIEFSQKGNSGLPKIKMQTAVSQRNVDIEY